MSLMNKIKNKEHIIWDWNGTILDDVSHAVETMNYLLRNSNLPTITIDKYKKIFEFPVKKYYDKLGFDYSLNSFENLCHSFVDQFMDGFSKCFPFDAIEQVLIEIKKSRKIQSVLSATDQENLKKMVTNFNFDNLFDHVYGIDNKLASSKIYRGKQLLEKLDISKEMTVPPYFREDGTSVFNLI